MFRQKQGYLYGVLLKYQEGKTEGGTVYKTLQICREKYSERKRK